MKDILVTQFLLPNKRPYEVKIERPDDIAEKAEKLKKLGFKLEVENNDDVIWMSCVDHSAPDSPRAVDEFVRNGPGVPDAFDRMINRAYEQFYKDDDGKSGNT